ncbi:cytochrome c oxidase assembly protein [Microbulbifer elongatus]|uniref:Cytochrome c oxidase assembly protein n=1 Tax=Microbulbifer elongatus TaxID=86173 RepID=A0ABT1P0W2_9GAMM|nr:cytochrome c oxidase assembly protein [Microbulbifer elongatus]MCQ3829755.1 cytochrome c oxidase assembly protein [Microbulbifer elongatus]
MTDVVKNSGIGPDSFYRTYCGDPPPPESLWAHWNFDPFVLCFLGLLLYFACRSPRHCTGLAATAVLFITFVSPLCALSSALFSARVAHHVLLFTVAAPLLAAFAPTRRATTTAGAAFVVSSLILWVWHAPPLYDLALSHVGVYWLMQASLLLSAVWFWRVVLDARRPAVQSIYLTVAGLTQMGLLGALLTFAPEPLYAAHASAPLAWGLTPLADQQLAGLIMWVPAIVPYIIVGAWRAHSAWSQLLDRTA